MININDFVKELIKNNLTFSAGVPNSLFKNLCNFQHTFKKNHLVSANEGSAIGLVLAIICLQKFQSFICKIQALEIQ